MQRKSILVLAGAALAGGMTWAAAAPAEDGQGASAAAAPAVGATEGDTRIGSAWGVVLERARPAVTPNRADVRDRWQRQPALRLHFGTPRVVERAKGATGEQVAERRRERFRRASASAAAGTLAPLDGSSRRAIRRVVALESQRIAAGRPSEPVELFAGWSPAGPAPAGVPGLGQQRPDEVLARAAAPAAPAATDASEACAEGGLFLAEASAGGLASEQSASTPPRADAGEPFHTDVGARVAAAPDAPDAPLLELAVAPKAPAAC